MNSSRDIPGNSQGALYSLKELYRLGNNSSEFIIKMIETFIKGATEISTQMKESLKINDWSKIKSMAHKAIPSFSFMGLGNLIEKLRFIEKNALDQQEQNQIKEYIAFIEKNIALVNSELQKEILNLKRGTLKS
jgi:HPt (histidine-containing phosphotransfer) domain-containing protein